VEDPIEQGNGSSTCSCFMALEAFWQEAMASLFDLHTHMVELESVRANAVANNASVQAEMASFDMDDLKIDPQSLADIGLKVTNPRDLVNSSDLFSSTLVSSLQQFIDQEAAETVAMVDSQTGDWREQWLSGVVNMTFQSECGGIECSGFADCAIAGADWVEVQLERRLASVCYNISTTDFAHVTGCSSQSVDEEMTSALTIALAATRELRDALEDAVHDTSSPVSPPPSPASPTATVVKTAPEVLAAVRTPLRGLSNVAGTAALFCGDSPTFLAVPASADVGVGEPLELACAATGLPVPTLVWTKDGAVLEGETANTFRRSQAAPADAGIYTCIASNAIGDAESARADVRVFEKSSFNLLVHLELEEPSVAVDTDMWVVALADYIGVPIDMIDPRSLQIASNSTRLSAATGPLLSPEETLLPTNSSRTAIEFVVVSRPDAVTVPAVQARLGAFDCGRKFDRSTGFIAVNGTGVGYHVASTSSTFVQHLRVREGTTLNPLFTIDDPSAEQYPVPPSFDLVSVTELHPRSGLRKESSSSPFRVNSWSGEILMTSPLDREAASHHMVRVAATYSMTYPGRETADHECPDLSSVGREPWAGDSGSLATLGRLAEGDYDCSAVISPLLQQAQPGFHQSLGFFRLQAACNEYCPLHDCGSHSHVCPMMPALVGLTRLASGASGDAGDGGDGGDGGGGGGGGDGSTAAQCDSTALVEVGACVRPNRAPCDPRTMIQAREALVSGTRRTCELQGRFYHAATACADDMRIDKPLLKEITQTCRAECEVGWCADQCAETDVGAVAAMLAAGVAADVEEGCLALFQVEASLAACGPEVLADTRAHPVLAARLREMRVSKCSDIVQLSAYTPPSPAQLVSAARAIDKLSCEQVDTFILAVEQCEVVVEPAALRAALNYCEESCLSADTEIQCSTRATHDFIVAITVDDINDNRPLFSQEVYVIRVDEPAVVEIGRVIAVIGASDVDTSSHITYRLVRTRSSLDPECEVVQPSSSSVTAVAAATSATLASCEWTNASTSPDAGMLRVNPVSGAVTVGGELDYEASAVIWLEVEASDGRYVAAASVAVRLVDVNDNTPTIEAKTPIFLREDAPVGTRLTSHMMVRVCSGNSELALSLFP
jgi:hypothetical protein